jgi:hypothetical protein
MICARHLQVPERQGQLLCRSPACSSERPMCGSDSIARASKSARVRIHRCREQIRRSGGTFVECFAAAYACLRLVRRRRRDGVSIWIRLSLTNDPHTGSSVLYATRMARCFVTIFVVLLSIFAKDVSTNGKSTLQTNRSSQI